MTEFDPRFKTLNEIYEAGVSGFPERPLFGTKSGADWQWMTYREFGDTVEQARGGLAALGVEKGDRVALISDNRPEWAVIAYGSYGLGASVVPMYEKQSPEEWHFILDDSGAKVVVVANEAIRDDIVNSKAELDDLQHIVVMDGSGDDSSMAFSDLLAGGVDSPAAIADVSPDDVAGFVYTSGTTGRPKGVLLTHFNLASNVSAIHEVFPLEPDDRSVSFLPWAHSFGQTVELHVLFSMGCSTAIAESIPKLVENMAEVQPTILVSVPRVFNGVYDRVNGMMDEAGGIKKMMFDSAISNEQKRRELANEGRTNRWVDMKHGFFDKIVFSKVRAAFGGRLKYAFSGGAAMSPAVGEFIDNLGVQVYEGYGLSETSPIATANWPGTVKIGTVGKAIPGVSVSLTDAAGEDPDEGEIVVHGYNVMKGYYNLPDENAKVFTEDGGFRTGDIGRIDADGFLSITGRVKEQYKLENGKYVVPTPIEEQLKLSPFIINAMIYGDNRPYNIALIVVDMVRLQSWASGQGIDTSDTTALLTDSRVRAKFEEEIAANSSVAKGYERVREFVLLAEDFTTENGMMTPTLKVKRRVVLDTYDDNIEELYEDA